MHTSKLTPIAFYFLLLLTSIFIFSCSSSKKAQTDSKSSDTTGMTADTLLYVVRGGCFGKCPIDKTVFFTDGTVKYRGSRFVEHIGSFETKISKGKVEKIKKEVLKADYFSLKKRYPNNPRDVIADLPMFTTEVRMDGKIHRVINRHNAPASLNNFKKFVTELIEGLKFDDKKKKK